MERAGAAVAREALQRVPGRAANRRRLRWWLERRRRPDRGPDPSRGGLRRVETTAVEQADVIVDALFGTGFHGEPRAEAAATIERINAAGAPVVSVDIPSGVDASTGEIAGEAVRATLTVTFHGRQGQASRRAGALPHRRGDVADIGLEPLETELRLVTPAILSLVPRKRPEDNKYTRRRRARRRRVARDDGSRLPRGRGGVSRRRRLRGGRRPRASLPIVEARLLEPVKVTWAGRARRRREGGRARDRPRARARRRRR